MHGKIGLASDNEFPPIWHERKVLWDSTVNYEPRCTTTVGGWKWDFSFLIPDFFDDSSNGGLTLAPMPGNLDLKVCLNHLKHLHPMK